MSKDFGSFRPLLQFNSVVGTNVTSLETLKVHKGKVVYTVSIAVVFAVEVYLIVWDKRTIYISGHAYATILRLWYHFMMQYFLITAILDHKTKISSALNLEAIKKELKATNLIQNRLKKCTFVALAPMLVLFVAIIIDYVYLAVTEYRALATTGFVTSFYLRGAFVTQWITCWFYLANIKVIQEAIVRDIAEAPSDAPTSPQRWAHSRRARGAGLEIQLIRDGHLQILSVLQGVLFKTEMEIKRLFRTSIIFWTTFIVLILISRFSQNYSTGSAMFGLASNLWMFLMLIIVVTQLQQLKQELPLQLLNSLHNYRSQSGRRRVKLKMLANIHRSRPYSCRLCDVDFSLLEFVVELILMVLVTALDN